MWQQRHAFLNAFDILISPIFRVATLPALAWNSGRWRRRATLFCLWWRLTLDEIKIGVHKYITTIFKPSALLSIFPIWCRWWKLRLSTSKKISKAGFEVILTRHHQEDKFQKNGVRGGLENGFSDNENPGSFSICIFFRQFISAKIYFNELAALEHYNADMLVLNRLRCSALNDLAWFICGSTIPAIGVL